MTPTAPAAAALSAFTEKSHEPRWISAMLPAGNPAKSAASQPLVDAWSPTMFTSTAVTDAVTSPSPEKSIGKKSTPSV